MQDQVLDALVVGGGAAGLATAIGLAQAGLASEVIGVPEQIRDDSRSAALFATTMAFMDTLGLETALKKAGWPLAAIRLIDITGALVRAPTTTFKAAEIGQPLFGYNIPNAKIIEILREAASNTPNLAVSSLFVEGFRETGDHLLVTLSDGSQRRTRVLIGADGQKSRVREAAGIEARTKPYPQSAITCRLKHTKDHEDISLEFHTREGPFTFVPVGDHESALVWIMKPERVAEKLDKPREALAQEITRRNSAALGTVEIIGPVAAVPLQKLVADKLVEGRVALVGEAAHAFPPIGAQGLNLGLKDVEALIKRLGAAKAAGTPLEDALPLYAKDRKMDVEMRAAGVDMLNSALIADLLPFDIARAIGLNALKSISPLRRLAMRVGGWNPVFGNKGVA
jgi:2-octaprenyl-6-methoxyphenol hydroxylase